ncbi:MAG: Hpt domain-containing protein, partial [Planctomycetes bacterium]|nr:Hpt domain-containing protein [Planctomycetota bacterium]
RWVVRADGATAPAEGDEAAARQPRVGLLEEFGPEGWSELVNDFIAGVPVRSATLVEAIAARQATAVVEQAHQLAGASALLDLPTVSQICRRIEDAAGSGRWPQVDGFAATLERELTAAIGRLRAEVAALAAGGGDDIVTTSVGGRAAEEVARTSVPRERVSASTTGP